MISVKKYGSTVNKSDSAVLNDGNLDCHPLGFECSVVDASEYKKGDIVRIETLINGETGFLIRSASLVVSLTPTLVDIAAGNIGIVTETLTGYIDEAATSGDTIYVKPMRFGGIYDVNLITPLNVADDPFQDAQAGVSIANGRVVDDTGYQSVMQMYSSKDFYRVHDNPELYESVIVVVTDSAPQVAAASAAVKKESK